MTRTPQPSGRSDVAAFEVMRVLAAADARRRRGLEVFDFSAGQPATGAPEPVLAAARRALSGDRIGYTGALGLPELREAVAAHYRTRYELTVDPANVVITTGSSGGLQLSFLAAFDPGDTVVVTRPGYPAVRNMLLALGCRVVDVALDDSGALTVADLEALDEVPAGVVVASPSNPTGSMLDASELAAVASWCQARSVLLVSDEIYHGITYLGPASSAWAQPAARQSSIVLSSFSKYFSMTGWRIGWLLVPDVLLDAVDRLAANFTICPPTLSQHAAIAAFDAYEELDTIVARYADNRRFLLDALPTLGLHRLAPVDGAFYVYADVSAWTQDSLSWAARLLADTGVALAPGLDFDHLDGGRWIRLCFAGHRDELERGVGALAGWLAAQPRSAPAPR